jgi:hypothetical protein
MDLSVCDGEAVKDPFKDLSLASGIDGLEVRRAVGAPGKAVDDTLVASIGSVCKVDEPAKSQCRASVDALSVSGGWDDAPPGFGGPQRANRTYAIATTASSVNPVDTFPKLLQALAPTNTLGEAILVVQQNKHYLDCTKPRARKLPEGGFELVTRTGGVCADLIEHLVRVSPDGSFTIVKSVVANKYAGGPCPVGRRPEGLVRESSVNWTQSVCDMLTEIAQLEAASVHTFADLATQLDRLGAPEELIARARAAEADEVAHAKRMTALANKYGGAPAAPVIRSSGPRTLLELALENVREGCVRELYGALVAHYQAETASDPEIAEAMATIAADETAHAELSLDLARWYAAQLGSDERAFLGEALRTEFAALEDELACNPASAVQDLAGMPDAATARHLLRQLRDTVPEIALAA